MPELTYQDIDLSNRILRSYITYMVNGDMYQYILEHLSEPVELRYLKEVLTIAPDYDNRMVTLNALRARFLQVCNLTQKGFPRCLERRKFTHVIFFRLPRVLWVGGLYPFCGKIPRPNHHCDEGEYWQLSERES